MGSFLGKGYKFNLAKKKFMPKDTVEGEQLAREIAPFILKKIDRKKSKKARFSGVLGASGGPGAQEKLDKKPDSCVSMD